MTYKSVNAQLGVNGLYSVDTLSPTTAATGSAGRWPQLGSITTAYDPATGIVSGGEFIYLSVPASTAIPAGTIVTWDQNYQVAAMATSLGGTGRSVAVAHTAYASNTSVTYAWFQIQGRVNVLKTAVAVPPASRLFISGTAGRIYATSSTGKGIVTMLSHNTATVASGTSTVLVFINRPHVTST